MASRLLFIGRMNLRVAALPAALLATALLAGCNDSSLTARAVDASNPHNDGQTVDPPTLHPVAGDQDGDGLPDGQDNVPCAAYYLKIWNQNVSSASVTLDGNEVVGPSAFPTDEVLQFFVNPNPGTNVMTLGARLAGSPGDELHFELWDMNGTLYLHETVVRGNGEPEEPPPISFDVTSQC